MIGYKLFRVRKNGTLGSLFIGRKAIVPVGVWLDAQSHRTKGYAFRPGWHITHEPYAPHLSIRDRTWYKVSFDDYQEIKRPESQGGVWYVAQKMKVLEPVPWKLVRVPPIDLDNRT